MEVKKSFTDTLIETGMVKTITYPSKMNSKLNVRNIVLIGLVLILSVLGLTLYLIP